MDLDLVNLYLKEIGKYKLLTYEQEQSLAATMNCDTLPKKTRDDARDILINSSLRLVIRIASAYLNRGVDLMDLIQEGSIGLIRGVDDFDYTRHYKLSTYVTPKIIRAITHCIEKNSSTVKVAQPMLYLIQLVKRAKRELNKSGKYQDKEIPIEEIYAKVKKLLTGKTTNIVTHVDKLKLHHIKLAMRVASTTYMSMDEALSDDDTSRMRHEILSDDGISEPKFQMGELEIPIVQMIDVHLSPKQRDVIIIRFGLLGNHAESLKNTAAALGISVKATMDLEKRALRKLKRRMQ